MVLRDPAPSKESDQQLPTSPTPTYTVIMFQTDYAGTPAQTRSPTTSSPHHHHPAPTPATTLRNRQIRIRQKKKTKKSPLGQPLPSRQGPPVGSVGVQQTTSPRATNELTSKNTTSTFTSPSTPYPSLDPSAPTRRFRPFPSRGGRNPPELIPISHSAGWSRPRHPTYQDLLSLGRRKRWLAVRLARRDRRRVPRRWPQPDR